MGSTEYNSVFIMDVFGRVIAESLTIFSVLKGNKFCIHQLGSMLKISVYEKLMSNKIYMYIWNRMIRCNKDEAKLNRNFRKKKYT